MSNDLTEVLRDVAKRYNARIVTVHAYDSNVCRYVHSEDKPWEFITLSGEPFSKKLQFAHRGRRIRFLANTTFLNCSIESSSLIEPMSINKPNAVNPQLKEAGTLEIGRRQYPIFTETASLDSGQRALLADSDFLRLMDDISLGTQESLHLTQEDISVYFFHPHLERISRAVEGFADFGRSGERNPGPDLTILPKQFHSLIPLIEEWSLGDDSDREDFLAAIPRMDLEIFVRKVEPFLGSIDSYLASFGEQAPPPEATALGRLAECALEAGQILVKRTLREN